MGKKWNVRQVRLVQQGFSPGGACADCCKQKTLSGSLGDREVGAVASDDDDLPY